MDVEVTVEAENLDTGERVLTGTALVTTVALQHGQPIEVNPSILKTDEDKKRFHEGESRMLNRLKEAGKISLPDYLFRICHLICAGMDYLYSSFNIIKR